MSDDGAQVGAQGDGQEDAAEKGEIRAEGEAEEAEGDHFHHMHGGHLDGVGDDNPVSGKVFSKEKGDVDGAGDADEKREGRLEDSQERKFDRGFRHPGQGGHPGGGEDEDAHPEGGLVPADAG